MLPKVLEQINEADLRKLLEFQVREGKSIEYKKEMHLIDSDDQKVRHNQRTEFLKDVSSFANTLGGDLLIGIKDGDGAPIAIDVVSIASIDKLKQQLCELLLQWVEPRISCAIHAVPLANGNHVLVLRIAQSMNSPHRVIYQNIQGDFYSRDSKGAHPMDTSELRQAFLLSESRHERISNFVSSRVQLIANGDCPVLVSSGAKIAVHLLPLEAFTGRTSYSAEDLRDATQKLRPLNSDSECGRSNLDGRIISTQWEHDSETGDYVQIFRNGAIEAVSGNAAVIHQGTKFFRPNLLKGIVRRLPRYLEFFEAVGIPPPVFLFVSLLDVNGCWYQDGRHIDFATYPFNRAIVRLPELRLDDFSINPLDCLKPVFDAIWNGWGYPICPVLEKLAV